MKELSLPFEGIFVKNNFFSMTNERLKKKLEKNFNNETAKIIDIEYAGETVEYIIFRGTEVYAYNPNQDPEEKKIIVDEGGNIWVLPIDAEIVEPFRHKVQANETRIYGCGNIHYVR